MAGFGRDRPGLVVDDRYGLGAGDEDAAEDSSAEDVSGSEERSGW